MEKTNVQNLIDKEWHSIIQWVNMGLGQGWRQNVQAGVGMGNIT